MKALGQFIEFLIKRGMEGLGFYLSNYMAKVVSVEDPKNQGRVKLEYTFLPGKLAPDIFAYPKGNYMGNNGGSWNLPQVGDMVWVEFERGNLNYPIWSFGYPKKNQFSDKYVNPKNKWFKTPEGLEVFWDAENSELKILHPNNNTLTITSDILLGLSSDGYIDLVEANPGDNAVLHSKNKKHLEEAIEAMEEIRDLLVQVASTDSAIASTLGLSYPVSYGQTATSLTTKLTQLSNSLDQSKSDKVRLK